MSRLALAVAVLVAATANSDDPRVNREAWGLKIVHAMRAICETEYFDACFVESVEQCGEQVVKIGTRCLADPHQNVPETILPDDRGRYARIIAACVSEGLEDVLNSTSPKPTGCP